MLKRFTKEARAVVTQAEAEARALGARTVEAEHLLLALARRGDIPLSHDEVLAALDEELRASLAGVGVTLADYEPLRVHPTTGPVRFGASAKLALERTLQVALRLGERRLDGRAVARGVLTAERGTVPRVLAAAGADPYALWPALPADG